MTEFIAMLQRLGYAVARAFLDAKIWIHMSRPRYYIAAFSPAVGGQAAALAWAERVREVIQFRTVNGPSHIIGDVLSIDDITTHPQHALQARACTPSCTCRGSVEQTSRGRLRSAMQMSSGGRANVEGRSSTHRGSWKPRGSGLGRSSKRRGAVEQMLRSGRANVAGRSSKQRWRSTFGDVVAIGHLVAHPRKLGHKDPMGVAHLASISRPRALQQLHPCPHACPRSTWLDMGTLLERSTRTSQAPTEDKCSTLGPAPLADDMRDRPDQDRLDPEAPSDFDIDLALEEMLLLGNCESPKEAPASEADAESRLQSSGTEVEQEEGTQQPLRPGAGGAPSAPPPAIAAASSSGGTLPAGAPTTASGGAPLEAPPLGDPASGSLTPAARQPKVGRWMHFAFEHFGQIRLDTVHGRMDAHCNRHSELQGRPVAYSRGRQPSRGPGAPLWVLGRLAHVAP